MDHRRTVLITGCSSGFGRVLVSSFLEKGWNVVATLRKAESRKSIFQSEIHTYGDQLRIVELDVTLAQDRTRIGEWVGTHCGGKLDCLVANAGNGIFGLFESFSEEQVRAQMEVNFFGTILSAQALLPALRAAQGRLVVISSVAGFFGLPIYSMYAASKHAIEGWLESLSYELRPWGVGCTLIEPGGFKTDFLSNETLIPNQFPENSPYNRVEKSLQRRRHSAMRKMGDPRHVADAVYRAATVKCPPLRIRCGSDARAAFLLKTLFPGRLFTWVMGFVEKLLLQ